MKWEEWLCTTNIFIGRVPINQVVSLISWWQNVKSSGRGFGASVIQKGSILAKTLNQRNNTEHICFTIAQTFFSLYFPCLIVKVPDGAESLLWWVGGEECQTWKVRHALPAHLRDNKPLTHVASGVMFQGISAALWKCGGGNLLQSGWLDVCDWDLVLIFSFKRDCRY